MEERIPKEGTHWQAFKSKGRGMQVREAREVRLREGAGLSRHVLPGAKSGADDARVGLHTSGG